MPLQINGPITGNIVEIDDEVQRDFNGAITLSGEGNVVRIGRMASRTGRLNIILGQRCSVNIGAGCHIGQLSIFGRIGAAFEIGGRTVFNGSCNMQAHEPGRILLGMGCLIASGTNLTVSDMHSIIDVETGIRINHAADIILGITSGLVQRPPFSKAAILARDRSLDLPPFLRATCQRMPWPREILAASSKRA